MTRCLGGVTRCQGSPGVNSFFWRWKIELTPATAFGGKQGPLFEGGNEYLRKNFPRLDFIKTATVIRR
jgi:hypothetical protein